MQTWNLNFLKRKHYVIFVHVCFCMKYVICVDKDKILGGQTLGHLLWWSTDIYITDCSENLMKAINPFIRKMYIVYIHIHTVSGVHKAQVISLCPRGVRQPGTFTLYYTHFCNLEFCFPVNMHYIYDWKKIRSVYIYIYWLHFYYEHINKKLSDILSKRSY